jgi:hypothetical protein
MTSAARPMRSSLVPCAMRPSPLVEHGITTMASQPAEPEAKGARKSSSSKRRKGGSGGRPSSWRHTSAPAFDSTTPTSSAPSGGVARPAANASSSRAA